MLSLQLHSVKYFANGVESSAQELSLKARFSSASWSASSTTAERMVNGDKVTRSPTRRVNGRVRRCVTEAPSRTPCHISGPSGSMRFSHRTVSSICTSVGRRWRPTRAGRTRSGSAKVPCSESGGSSRPCFSDPWRMGFWSGIPGAALNAHRRRSEQGFCCLMPKSPFGSCCLPGFSDS